MLNCHTYELNCYICKYKDGDEMNVNGLLQQNFNETLEHLGKASNPADFEEVLGVKGQAVAKAVDHWIEENLDKFKNGDISALYGIKNKLVSLFHVDPNDSSINKINQICQKILNELIAQAMKEITDEKQKEKIQNVINNIPPEQTAQVLDAAAPFIADIANGYDRARILNEIKDIPHEQRAQVLNLVAPYVTDIANRFDRVRILNAIKNIPPEILAVAVPFIKDIAEGCDRASILKEIKDIPPEILAEAAPFIKDIAEGYGRAGILKEVKDIPPEQIKQVLNLAAPYIIDTKVGYERANILSSSIYFPPQRINDFFQTIFDLQLLGEREIGKGEIIQKVLLTNLSLQEPTHIYLFEKLQSPDLLKTHELAEFIWNNKENFLLYEEHLLAQEALQKLILTKATHEPKNPYTIYKKLQEEQKLETPLFEMPIEEIAGKKVSFDLEAAKHRAAQKQVITFGDLPQGIKYTVLQDLFEPLEKRLANEDSSVKERAEKAIEEMTSGSFGNLRNNFAKDPYLQSLLAATGKSSNPAPLGVAHFLAILKYILDQSNVVKEGEFFSPQEEMLLKMSASIQNCSTGKSEGIAIAYNMLPPEYRYGTMAANLPGKERGLLYLDSLIQNVLNSLMTNEAMLKEMIGENRVEQLSHQAYFLKNRIGPRIGLEPTLKFDPHTDTLYDNLINKDLAGTLEVFFKHFKIQDLIKQLQIRFVQDKESVEHLFEQLDGLLVPEVNRFQVWELDEENIQAITFKGLSEAGAREIWLASGYLKEI
jgi:hypothetical protein